MLFLGVRRWSLRSTLLILKKTLIPRDRRHLLFAAAGIISVGITSSHENAQFTSFAASEPKTEFEDHQNRYLGPNFIADAVEKAVPSLVNLKLQIGVV